MASAAELWSRDAGTFYCNEVLYRTLDVVRSRRLRPLRSSFHATGTGSSSTADAGRASLLPAVFIHLPSPNVSSARASAVLVGKLACQMVGRFVPPAAAVALAAAVGQQSGDGSDVACTAPLGRYVGAQTVLGYTVHISAGARRLANAASGTLELNVSSTSNLIAFACADEPWRLEAAAAGHGAGTWRRRADRVEGSASPRAVLVDGDACWRDNVQANIQDLRLTFNPADNSVTLTGRHRVAFFLVLPLEATLHAEEQCAE